MLMGRCLCVRRNVQNLSGTTITGSAHSSPISPVSLLLVPLLFQAQPSQAQVALPTSQAGSRLYDCTGTTVPVHLHNLLAVLLQPVTGTTITGTTVNAVTVFTQPCFQVPQSLETRAVTTLTVPQATTAGTTVREQPQPRQWCLLCTSFRRDNYWSKRSFGTTLQISGTNVATTAISENSIVLQLLLVKPYN